MILLEAAVDSLEAAMAAEKAGADRLELCSALELGGLTPGCGLMRLVAESVSIPVFALLRTRGGGFCYTDEEHRTLLREIEMAGHAGMQGIVIGALGRYGGLHLARMKEYLSAADGLSLTCHRAFDRVPDLSEALRQLVDLGVPRVLSSGGKTNAWEGREVLKNLVEQAGDSIKVLVGAGVSASNARELVSTTGAQELHFSAIRRAKLERNSIPMGLLDQDEWTILPDPDKVNAIRKVVE